MWGAYGRGEEHKKRVLSETQPTVKLLNHGSQPPSQRCGLFLIRQE
jgi:hypothetical protein